MAKLIEIQTKTTDGITYHSLTVRGNKYLIYKNGGEWKVGSMKLHCRFPQTWRYFKTLKEIGTQMKNLKNIHLMIEAV